MTLIKLPLFEAHKELESRVFFYEIQLAKPRYTEDKTRYAIIHCVKSCDDKVMSSTKAMALIQPKEEPVFENSNSETQYGLIKLDVLGLRIDTHI